MRKISSPGATAGGEFKETPAPATRIDAVWLNTLQAEIVGVITGAGIALDAADNTQLAAAIQARITALFGVLFPAAFEDAFSDTFGGAFADAVAAALANVITVFTDSNGVMLKIAMGGVTLKIETGKVRGAVSGEVTQAVAFRAPFTGSASYRVFAQPVILAASTNQDLWVQAIESTRTINGLTFQYQADGSDNNAAYGFDWLAIGLLGNGSDAAPIGGGGGGGGGSEGGGQEGGNQS